ncbi:MAG: hypothetical protein V2A78_10825 [bacterium]
MNFNVNVKRKLKINGKEYNSVEEMPDEIRKIFMEAINSQASSEDKANPSSLRTKIIFNGAEYESLDAMPQDVRQLYETVLKAAESGTAPPAADLAGITGDGIRKELERTGIAPPGGIPRPPGFEPFISRWALIAGAALAALILLLYHLYLVK